MSTIALAPRWCLAHEKLRLDDGHQVGVSVAGSGIPLVLLHGIGMNRFVYLRLLSRLPRLGFLVVGIDAAGHGETSALPRGGRSFADQADLVVRTMDALGLRSAVVVGHSMGGRTAIHLAAERPDLVLAAVLMDAAGGDSFDARARTILSSPLSMMHGLVSGLYDMQRDQRGLPRAEKRIYRSDLLGAVRQLAMRPARMAAAVAAVAGSGPTGVQLAKVREQGTPMILVHGERDLVVPWTAALDMAQAAGAPLYLVPGAYHSWMIADPRRGADVMRQLLEGELAAALTRAADRVGEPTTPAGWQRALVAPHAAALRLAAGAAVIGEEPVIPVEGQVPLRRVLASAVH